MDEFPSLLRAPVAGRYEKTLGATERPFETHSYVDIRSRMSRTRGSKKAWKRITMCRSLARAQGTKEGQVPAVWPFPKTRNGARNAGERGESRGREGRGVEVIAQSDPEILARSSVPFPRARAHARRYLAERDKSLVPHVIKSFSRSRGSKGKERRTLERAG